MQQVAFQDVLIAGRPIGPGHPPFIIAEMSGNHNQSLERALQIVDAAAQAGADALKLQTYTADTLTLDLDEDEFYISDPDNLWNSTTLYKLYQQAYTPWEWHAEIFERCRKHGMIGFSSPFDPTAVDFLESLNVPAYKIASCELVDLPLIQKTAATGKPLIMSTGMASEAEIAEAVDAARGAGCRELILLKCTTSYPADPRDSNLRAIPYLQERFQVQVGLSDHTLGVGAAVAATALGATVIEKHITLSRDDGGVDSTFSLEPAELALLKTETVRAHQALGLARLSLTDVERKSLAYRRSLYVAEDVTEGDVFNDKNLRSIRPANGLPPKHLPDILGKRATRSVPKGTPMQWDLVDR